MNRLVLIGNGFDLAHGLKTGYPDFIKSLFDLEKEVEGFKEKIVNIDQEYTNTINNVGDYRAKFVKDFKYDLFTITVMDEGTFINKYPKFLPNVPDHSLRNNIDFKFFKDAISGLMQNPRLKVSIKFKNKFIESLLTKANENWYEIEQEYYNQLKDIYENGNHHEMVTLNNELDEVISYLAEYLKSQEQRGCEKSKLIEEVINEEIQSREINYKVYKQPVGISGYKLSISRTMYLNFNYTSTLEKYERSSNINWIHGSLKEDIKSIIFGFGDELDESFRPIENHGNYHYLKNIKSVRYLKQKRYKELSNFLDLGYFQVIILGHSCSLPDRTLLNTIFEHEKCISVKPYYFEDQNNGYNNFEEIIQNIYRCFSDKRLMRDTVVNFEYTKAFSVIEKKEKE